MRSMNILIFAALPGFLCNLVSGQEISEQETLKVTESAGSYVLKVPISDLEMTIPKGRLRRDQSSSGGATNSPRFFYLKDDSSNLIISGWFEPEAAYKGIKQLWAGDTAAWKAKGLPDPQDVSFVDIGKWSVVFYDHRLDGMRSSHVRAEWVQAGTWIDLHISITGTISAAEQRARLRDVLGSIQVAEKASGSSFETPRNEGSAIDISAGAGGGGQEHTYIVPGHGKLSLPVPAHWKDMSKPLPDPPSIVLRFRPVNGDAIEVQVTAMWLDTQTLAGATHDSLKASVLKSSAEPLKGAVEKEVKLEELRGKHTIGYYYSLTDRNPPPEEYKYLTQGISLTGEMMVVFTILHREDGSPDKASALQMLANATYSK